MRFLNAIRPRKRKEQLADQSGVSPGSFVASSSETDVNPENKLGDPLRSLTEYAIMWDYRPRINRGDLTIPTWALFNALRCSSVIGSYARLLVDFLSAMDWNIKVSDKSELAKKQQDVLRARYERLDVPGFVSHLALANLYGFSIIAKHPDHLEPLNWWNWTRKGLFGGWAWNPQSRQRDGRSLMDDELIDPANFIIRTVEQPVLIEYLRIYLAVNDTLGYWDDNLEKESKRQTVIIPGTGFTAAEADEFKAAARAIANGQSGCLAPGNGDRSTSVLYPPESRGLSYYDARIKLLEDWACRALFGSNLIANTESGSGTLAGGAHEDTATQRITGIAADISSVMQIQFDEPVLRSVGLLQDGDPPLAYYEIARKEQRDPAFEIDVTLKAAQAGYKRDAAELSDATGMTFTEGTPQTQHSYEAPASYFGNDGRALGSLLNRASSQLNVPPEWLVPIRDIIAELIEKAESGIDKQELALFAERMADRLPEVFDGLPIDKLAEALEGVIGGAALEGVRNAVAG